MGTVTIKKVDKKMETWMIGIRGIESELNKSIRSACSTDVQPVVEKRNLALVKFGNFLNTHLAEYRQCRVIRLLEGPDKKRAHFRLGCLG